jgi:hypothetical protein
LDFVDTLFWAYHAVDQQEVLTFDEKLRKYIEKREAGGNYENAA